MAEDQTFKAFENRWNVLSSIKKTNINGLTTMVTIAPQTANQDLHIVQNKYLNNFIFKGNQNNFSG